MSYWIAIDKPQGFTSNFIVQKIKKILNVTKIGHGGTLDPLATGVLPIAIGEATKTVQFIMNQKKIYEFEVQFGVQTDTDDIEGVIIANSDKLVYEKEILSVIPKFCGEIEQLPPQFSAKKVDGVRAYKLAREKKEFTLEVSKIFIHNLSLLDFDFSAQKATFAVEAGKGTYVRALARDLGYALGSYAHVSKLRRKKLGYFDETLLISLENLEKIVHNSKLNDHRLSLDFVLVDIPAIEITSVQKVKVRHGCSIILDSNIMGQVRLMNQKELIAIGNLNNKIFSIERVFNNLNPNS